MSTPFDPPAYAGYESRLAYEKLSQFCSAVDASKPKSMIETRELIETLSKTYYNLGDFIGFRTDADLCRMLDNAHWWNINGPAIYWWLSSAAVVLTALSMFVFIWQKRAKALSLIDEGIVSGFASGVKAKRRLADRFGDYKRRVHDRAERDS